MIGTLLLWKSDMNLTSKLTLSVISSLAGLSFLAEQSEKEMLNYEKEIYPPIDIVSIIIPTYNEEQFIEYALRSIKDQLIIQRYPDMFEILLIDSGSTDNTVDIAKKYVDKIILSPRGKLTARNLATLESRGNIIVAVDADCYYPQGYLNSILAPFNDLSNPDYNNVIAVEGSTIDYSIPKVSGRVYTLGFLFERYIRYPNRLHGRNSAYWKHAFYQVQQFNENINQLDDNEMVKEEEVGFGQRLSKIGKLIWKKNTACIHLGGLKVGCRNNTISKNICDSYKIGIERFG